jgi:hypothetical protein
MLALHQKIIALAATTLAIVPSESAFSQESSGESEEKAEAVLSPTYGFATFDEALQFAENSYLYGDYLDVVQTLWTRLLPEPVADASDDVLVRAYTLLGTAAHFEEQGRIADDAFLEVLRRAPDIRLDPLLYPPRVIERFEAVRDANVDELDEVRGPDERRSTLYIQQEVREQSLLVSMLPFGYGFFTSDRDAQGVGYLIGETLLATTMIGLYASNELARSVDGFYEDPERAENRGRAQRAIAGGFTGLVLINAVHGAVTHDRSRRLSYRTLTEPPPELRDEGGDSSRRPRWRVSFTPLVSF